MEVRKDRIPTNTKKMTKIPLKIIVIAAVSVIVVFSVAYVLVSLPSPPKCLQLASKPPIYDSARVGEIHTFTFSVQTLDAENISLCKVALNSPSAFGLHPELQNYGLPFPVSSVVIEYYDIKEKKSVVVANPTEELKGGEPFSDYNTYKMWKWTGLNADVKAGMSRDINFTFVPYIHGKYLLELYLNVEPQNSEPYQTIIVTVEQNDTGN